MRRTGNLGVPGGAQSRCIVRRLPPWLDTIISVSACFYPPSQEDQEACREVEKLPELDEVTPDMTPADVRRMIVARGGTISAEAEAAAEEKEAAEEVRVLAQAEAIVRKQKKHKLAAMKAAAEGHDTEEL